MTFGAIFFILKKTFSAAKVAILPRLRSLTQASRSSTASLLHLRLLHTAIPPSHAHNLRRRKRREIDGLSRIGIFLLFSRYCKFRWLFYGRDLKSQFIGQVKNKIENKNIVPTVVLIGTKKKLTETSKQLNQE